MSGHASPVVVTGWAALSPGGSGLPAYRAWRAGAGRAARIADFEPAHYIRNPKLLRSMHRTFQLGSAAAVEAMRAAGLPSAESLAAAVAPEHAGIAAALSDLSPLTPDLLHALAEAAPDGEGDGGSWARFAELGLHQLHPFRRLTLLANMAAAHTSLLFGLQGPSFTFTSGATAGVQTLSESYWTIAQGHAELMVCQAAESPEQVCTAQPVEEMAGAVVLESHASAVRRGAPLQVELQWKTGAQQPPRFSLAQAGDGLPTAGLLAALQRLEALTAAGAGVALSQLLDPQEVAA